MLCIVCSVHVAVSKVCLDGICCGFWCRHSFNALSLVFDAPQIRQCGHLFSLFLHKEQKAFVSLALVAL